ncbi:hypothetical protein HJFPF1_08659 [Paramyrothecium foliicola]|nr:hypothetical protein HJFPF1_08659 [Paramyrothecium foliicola]
MMPDASAIPPAPTPEQAAAMAAAAQAFNNELWVLLAIGTLVTILRSIARVRNVGFKGLKPDDYLVWIGMGVKAAMKQSNKLKKIFYGIESGLAYSVGAYAKGMANNGMTDAHREALPTSSEEYRLRIIGSIIQLCGWSTYSTLLWSLKAAWLTFYIRLTDGLGRNYRKRIHIGYWQIYPNPGNMCHPATANNIVWIGYAMNVTTDLYLLSIPLPLLWTSQLHKWKKVGLICLFSGGLFVIICGTLRSVLIVTNPVNGAQLAGSWAVRETFVAIVTTNLPHVFSLIKNWLAPLIGTLTNSRRSSQKGSSLTPKFLRTFGGGNGSGPSWRGRGPPTVNPITGVTMNESGSEERMVGNNMAVEMDNLTNERCGKTTETGGSIQKMVEVDIVSEANPSSAKFQGSSSYNGMHQEPWNRVQASTTAYAQAKSYGQHRDG